MKNADPTDADYPLGPALDFLRHVWRLNHVLEKASSRMERRLGVTAQQRLFVRCIGKFPGVTASQLARLLHLDPGTVSVALNRLEDKGLLARRRDPRDKRRASLRLTPQGRKLDKPTQGTVEDVVERLLRTVPANTVRSFIKVVGQLTAFLDDAILD